MSRPRRSLARSENSLGRRSGFRKPRKTLLVLCEGERSEYDYIRALSLEPDVRGVSAVQIEIDTNSFGCAPMTLVRRAVSRRKRTSETNDEIDEVWCVFDVEWSGSNGQHHPNLVDAVQMARAHGVHIAISNPSFELWLILHYRNLSRFLTNDDARRIRAECDRSQGKGVDGQIYMKRRREAVRNAVLLDEKHVGDGTRFPQDNPSSGMHLLIASVSADSSVDSDSKSE